MNEILKCIEERRSIKSFKSDMPEREKIDAVIKAGLEAASGRNMQAPIIVALTNPEVRAKLAEFNGSLYGNPDPFYNAPVILIVLAEKKAHTFCLGERKRRRNMSKSLTVIPAFGENVDCFIPKMVCNTNRIKSIFLCVC